MVAGLLLSAVVAFVTQSNEQLLRLAANNFLLLIIAQLVLVFAIQLGISRVAQLPGSASSSSTRPRSGSRSGSSSPGSSSAQSLPRSCPPRRCSVRRPSGRVTKRSLAGIGGILLVGLIGLIAASVLNLLFANGGLSFIISIVGVGLFTVLTAYDVQRIQNGDLVVYTGSTDKAAVLGAVHLYLDFLNLFLFLLNLQSGTRE
jgi:FtsH-binding integral membrane protein